MNSAPIPAKQRFASIDILRGAVMLLMALDHVRHFLHLPAMVDEPTNLATTTPVLFFTRWITHFCAPVFLFLSGLSAFISGQNKTKKELSIFLIKRGFWLIMVELLVITFSWSFDPLYHIFFLQVIWAIGWSMVILGFLVRTSLLVITITGCVIFFGHNILDYVRLPEHGIGGFAWKILLTTRFEIIAVSPHRSLLLIYPILPWAAIMLLGYAAGIFYTDKFDLARRKKILMLSGIAFILVFILLRLINRYGDPAPWMPQKNKIFTLLSFLNVTKYPVSLMYGCLTLGPALILLSVLGTGERKLKDFNPLSVFGKAPLFYYVIHFFLIHIIGAVLFFSTGHTWEEGMTKSTIFLFRPLDFGFSLGIVYVIWILIILILYFPCRWFVQYKITHRQWWLKYV